MESASVISLMQIDCPRILFCRDGMIRGRLCKENVGVWSRGGLNMDTACSNEHRSDESVDVELHL